MFKDAFIKLDPVQTAKITDLVNPLLDVKFDPAASAVMIHNLPFYPGHYLVELSRHDEYPPVHRAAVCNDNGEVTILNWKKETVFALNQAVPVALDENNVVDYVRFYFTYVKGPHGRFLIVDTVDDIDWREEPAASGRKALGKMIQPLEVTSKTKHGGFSLRASMIFSGSLYQAAADVEANGQITLRDEELLVEDIPVADDLIGQ